MNFSPTISDYDIKFTNLYNGLVCVLNLNGLEFEAKITKSDLKIVSLNKLQKIILSNHKETQPFYTIRIGLVQDSNHSTQSTQITQKKYLVLEILYSGDIDFEEKIFFIQSNTIKNAFESKQLEQTKQITKLEKYICEQNETIRTLKNKLDKIENEQHICIQEQKSNDSCLRYKNVSKNIDVLEFINDNTVQLMYNFYGSELTFQSQYEIVRQKEIPRAPRLFGASYDTIPVFEIGTPYLFFNYKKIKDLYNSSACETIKSYLIKQIKFFIGEYLKKRNDYIVECIETIHNKEIIPILLEHTNYKKLKIKYDKEFDDREIKSHCDTNNIKFDYL